MATFTPDTGTAAPKKGEWVVDPNWYKKVPTWAQSAGGKIGDTPVSSWQRYDFLNTKDAETGLTPAETAFLQAVGEKQRSDQWNALRDELLSSGGGGGSSQSKALNDLASILLGQVQSGDYKKSTQELAGRLTRQTKRGRKQIKGGYQDLIQGLRGQTNPYANMGATAADVTSGLQDVLSAQGVGSGLLQEQLALLAANEQARQASYDDLANIMRGTWGADQQAAIADARANRRTALDALTGTRGQYAAQIAAREQQRKDEILQSLLDLVGRGASLPADWTKLFGGA